MPERVLVIEDEAAMRDLLVQDLRRRGHDVVGRERAPEQWEDVTSIRPDLIITDINLPGIDGLTLTGKLRDYDPDIPVVVITAFGTLEVAIAAIRAGAYDFVTKPFELEALALVVDRALEHRRLTAEVHRLRERTGSIDEVSGLVGDSAPIRRVKNVLSRVARTSASVLILGESGTGKEVVARELHRLSGRARGPFVAVNLAAVPAALLEGELFGHTKGAFTDAGVARPGLFVQADGGTLLLDELGELPLELQPKLLRALEEHCVRPLGSAKEVAFDARVIACTNRDLVTAVDEGRFREDLLYRLNVIEVELPPLRVRGRDILLLAQMFVDRFVDAGATERSSLAPEVARKLLAYSWPGNVRELRNCMEHAVALASGSRITCADLPPRVADFSSSHVVVASDDPRELVSLEEVERRYILRVLEAVGGNKAQAARILGLGRKTLYRKLEAYAKRSGGSA